MFVLVYTFVKKHTTCREGDSSGSLKITRVPDFTNPRPDVFITQCSG